MYFFGLHAVDLLITLLSLCAVLIVGLRLSGKVRGDDEFYVGKRSLGRLYQFFMNFGSMADPNAASIVASTVYAQGAGGVWFGFQLLFVTPIYWFSSVWFRRTRLITVSDLFQDRFNSRGLTTVYTVIALVSAIAGMAIGNLVSYKVVSAMVVKTPTQYTPAEARSVRDYEEFKMMRPAFAAGTLAPANEMRYTELEAMNKRGELRSYVSWLQPLPFYVAYSLIVCIYLLVGGLNAAAVTDVFQGVLILVFTVLLIPLGLSKVGGFVGLHNLVPDYKFALFGTEATGDMTWYSILALTVASSISVMGGGSPAAAAAKDEDAVRFGTVWGAFAKRVATIPWMFCGLLAIALFPGGLSDADGAWGALSLLLLPVGMIGVMLSAILLGHMPSVALGAVNMSALFTRNIYETVLPGRGEKHNLFVARASVVGFLGLSIVLSLAFSDFVSLLSSVITFNVFFGVMGLLIYFWRPLTARAILVSMVLWLCVIGIAPTVLGNLSAVRDNSAFTVETRPHIVSVIASAKQEDVDAGRAQSVGETITTERQRPRSAIFFDSVARVRPADPSSPLRGNGRFNVETYLLSVLGVPLTQFNSAQLVTARFVTDTVLPFLLLMGFSALFRTPLLREYTTKEAANEQEERTRRFFAKLKTPIAPTLEEDVAEIARVYADPSRADKYFLRPGATWAFGRPSQKDIAGFVWCWVVVAAILALLYGTLQVGK